MVVEKLKLDVPPADLTEWKQVVSRIATRSKTCTIALVGKYVKLHDAYLSVMESLYHAGFENDSQVEITDKNAVHLLTDEVLDDQVLIDHISNEIIGSDTGIPNGDYLYEFQYLDLVDSSNGNAYVTLGDGQTIDLYWPVPDDADTSAPFYIVHFDALDRDY